MLQRSYVYDPITINSWIESGKQFGSLASRKISRSDSSTRTKFMSVKDLDLIHRKKYDTVLFDTEINLYGSGSALSGSWVTVERTAMRTL